MPTGLPVHQRRATRGHAMKWNSPRLIAPASSMRIITW